MDIMYRSLSDPHAVLRFQNLCGLKQGFSDKNANTTKKDDAFPFKEGQTRPAVCRTRGRGHVRSTSDEKKQLKDEESLRYNPFFHRLYMFGSGLGCEAFYITFIPLLLWILDEYVARRLSLLWALAMFVGHSMKEKLRWPRPPSPPVIILDHHYDSEYGMPSTHAVAGTIFPFSIVYFTYGRYEYSFWLGVFIVVFWCGLVCLSRIYMGVHSFQDLLGGIGVAGVITALCLPFLDERLEEQIYPSPLLAPSIIFASIGMTYFFCSLQGQGVTKRDTTRIIASASGCQLGLWVNFCLLGLSPADMRLGNPFVVEITSAMVLIALFKFVVGVVLLVLTRASVKFLMLRLSPGMSPQIYKNESEAGPNVIACIFVTYYSIGLTASWIVPALFRTLGIA